MDQQGTPHEAPSSPLAETSMIDVHWAQTRTRKSWHILRTFTRVPGAGIALCGKRLDGETLRDNRPGNEATCENCYRIGGPR